MDTEKQPVELARLIEKLTGIWNVGISIQLADGTVLNGNGEMLVQQIVDGFGLRSEMELEIVGLGKYIEQDLWGYQPWGRKLHIYSITTTAAVHDHTGVWKDENSLAFQWEGINDGKSSTEELTLDWLSPSRIYGHEIDMGEGKVEAEINYNFTKK